LYPFKFTSRTTANQVITRTEVELAEKNNLHLNETNTRYKYETATDAAAVNHQSLCTGLFVTKTNSANK